MFPSDWRADWCWCWEVCAVVRPESDCVGDDTRQESDLYLICPDPGSCQHYHQHQPWYHTRYGLTAGMSAFRVEITM